jgi:two-component system nitrogen regulation response regulator GlnG/two-component system response regulator HydG
MASVGAPPPLRSHPRLGYSSPDMSTFFGQTTAPGAASTAEDAGDRPSLALVIAWSASQPHRVGEVAFFPFGERLYVGRGDVEVDKFAHFVRQRPGEMSAVDPFQDILGGSSLSRRQLTVRFTGDGLEVEQVGRCRTYINGQEIPKATLQPGDTVMFRAEVVLVCVSRPRSAPALQLERELHPFGEPDADGIVGESPAAWRMREQLARAARGEGHVLIQGDSGTGKEMAASVIHSRSSRANGPWVSRNASAFTSSLSVSELFGNPANYPNPGMAARKGLLGTADRGTFFLDEIGDCPLDVQAQLLRVMDQGEYQAVGEAVARRVDVRFVGATNRDESFFRSDFLARFLARVHLPPLRERREDIPLIARHFLLRHAQDSSDFRERFCRKGIEGRLEPNVSGRLIDELVRRPLPVNARELHGELRKAIDTSQGDELRLPTGAATTTVPPTPRTAKDAQGSALLGTPSRADILAWLDREEGKVARVARRLGMERTALYRLMKSYGIDRESRD